MQVLFYSKGSNKLKSKENETKCIVYVYRCVLYIHVYMSHQCNYHPSCRQTARLMVMSKMHLFMELSAVTCQHETEQKERTLL